MTSKVSKHIQHGGRCSSPLKSVGSDATGPETPPKKEAAERVEPYVSLGEIRFGTACSVRIFVFSKWDSTDLKGKPISTDYILSDEQGGAIHCTVLNGLSRRFSKCLEEGICCCIKGFTVKPNRERFRLRNGDKHCIQLEASTQVHRLDCDVSSFKRYSFQLTPLEDIVLNGSKYLADVIGAVARISYVNPTRNNSHMLDIHIQNERGTQMRVTLWGRLCDDFLMRYAAVEGAYALILPSTHVKEWKGEIYLSSTSATSIQDGKDIPAIRSFMALLSNDGTPVVDPPIPPKAPTEASLLQLLNLGREQKANRNRESITLHCEAKIDGVRPTHGWYYFACGVGNCKKGVSKVGEQFWCESCSTICEFPQTRYRLHLEISDGSASLPITVFDEIAEELIKKRASKLLEEIGFDVAVNVIPEEINLLANTCHVFELKTHTYFNHGDHESFTASRLIRSLPTTKAPVFVHPATPGSQKGPPTRDEEQETVGFNQICRDDVEKGSSSSTLKRKLSVLTDKECNET